ncbi:MAG: PIG-L family deacetylase [Cyclobacteriaceae bacterium]|nr:PIG-L family deacetylase [Cyclobacteriaceae bacterium]
MLTMVLVVIFAIECYPQKPHQKSASEIELGLRKLNFLGSVLYVAAHPDDENTRLIAYFSNEVLANTAYLSMTRGDGGQNLIGAEIREYLGVIRTQELLAARRTDGGSQFFTRANDFGYSKSPEETQEIWERDEVLSDVVWAFRKFRPDVIITRFPTDGRGGHGHHTTSAILAQEAFDISANKEKFKEQLKWVEPWQSKSLYLNTGRWWNTSITEDTPGVITINPGIYNPLLGKSYTEIAAESRTKHKSQGFGSTGSRGYSPEFLEFRKGEQAKSDIFEGINTTWTRVDGGEKVQVLLEKAIESFQPSNPSLSVPELIKVRKAISETGDSYWKNLKIKEVDKLITDCLGLYLEATSSDYMSSPGEVLDLEIEAINRSEIKVSLNNIKIGGNDLILNKELQNNIGLTEATTFKIPAESENSQPYWLQTPGSLGMYKVESQELRGTPENNPAISVEFELNILGEKIVYSHPVLYKWNDPVKGEMYRPFEISPPVFINVNENMMVFGDGAAKQIEVVVTSALSQFRGTLHVEVPKGWIVEPSKSDIELNGKWKEERIVLNVVPPKGESIGNLHLYIENSQGKFNKGLVYIDYDHIPIQSLFPESTVKMVKLDLKKKGNLIGYIHGAGDEIPASLRNVGYEVWEMSDDEITPDNLAKVDAVILGIRALNTRERLPFVMDDLLEYVKDGGTMIVQYNTTRGLKVDNFAPYPLTLSSNRVTREGTEVSFVDKKHPLLNGPNKITSKDFENWVQERGLYFPSEWDSKYTPILSMSDPGEDPLLGSLLVAEYGKGTYIYSGISWFRELPAGVPGAIKLFINLVSYGQEKESKQTKK